MIKLVLMAVFMLLCMFSGLAAEAFFKSRAAVLNDFLSFIRYAKRETEFLKTDVESLMEEYSAGGEFKAILDKALTDIRAGKKAECTSERLKKEARAEISAFFNGLTECDYYSKDALFGYSEAAAEELKQNAEKELKQKGELIKKLMFLLGVGLVVLLI